MNKMDVKMSELKPRILIVEDEPSQVALLRYNLTQQGFELRIATDGETGLQAAIEDPPDLVLLDWMLPKLSGIEICRQLRRHKETRGVRIIMLTARSEESDKIRGLDVGADDYVAKPYSIKELVARIRAALRRPATGVFDGKISVGQLKLDVQKHKISFAGEPVHTSALEFRLLLSLMQSPERVYTRDQLLDNVWGLSTDVDTRTVDVHIGRLRRTLEKAGCRGMIKTIRGFGYSIGQTETQL